MYIRSHQTTRVIVAFENHIDEVIKTTLFFPT